MRYLCKLLSIIVSNNLTSVLLGFSWPFSNRHNVVRLTPIRSANKSCVSFRFLRMARISLLFMLRPIHQLLRLLTQVYVFFRFLFLGSCFGAKD